MAGHSKWNNIKNRKGAVDAKRGKVFGQLARAIRIAVKEGKSDDPKFNPSLRLALDKAKAANMPKDKIKKAIERGSGKSGAGNMQEITYEGFGPSGVAFIVIAFSDNPNRTSAQIKHAFSKSGGSLAGPGAAQFLFKRGEKGEYVANMPLEIEDASEQQKIASLVESLENSDDVESVFHSAKMRAINEA